MEKIKELGEFLDIKRFLADEIHAGAAEEETLVEVLKEKLEELYPASDEDELWTMAELAVEENIFAAKFIAQAEDAEATDDYYERYMALSDAQEGRW